MVRKPVLKKPRVLSKDTKLKISAGVKKNTGNAVTMQQSWLN